MGKYFAHNERTKASSYRTGRPSAKLQILGLALACLVSYNYAGAVGPAAPTGNGNSGAIWTTTSSCGDPQNSNIYNIGDTVYINGSNFAAGTYNWQVLQLPANSGNIRSSGDVTVGADGKLCFAAYTLQPGDSGEYQASVGNKNDNFRTANDNQGHKPPTFPNCETLTPPGDLASYDSGLHQIPGGSLMEGIDNVYSIGDGNAVQCFHPPTGPCIQSNWWQTDAKAEDGWMAIANGADWGLQAAPYLVMNRTYDCGNPPTFPNCETMNPPGDLASYNSGLHQIPGGSLMEGIDNVYSLTDGNAVQCFQPPTGSCIQSNWWKTNVEAKDGWMAIADGADWGLQSGPYLVMNRTYDCNADVGGGETGGGGGADITVTKVVINDDGGSAAVADFTLKVGQAVVTSGVLATNFPAGSYDVTESGGPGGYTASFSGDCDSAGHITMEAAHTYNCTITNNDNPADVGGGGTVGADITVTKVVVNDNGGTAVAGDFLLKVGQAVVTSGVLATNFPAGSYDVTESGGPGGYTASFSGDCDSVGHITMEAGHTYTCTITNNDNPVDVGGGETVNTNTSGGGGGGYLGVPSVPQIPTVLGITLPPTTDFGDVGGAGEEVSAETTLPRTGISVWAIALLGLAGLLFTFYDQIPAADDAV